MLGKVLNTSQQCNLATMSELIECRHLYNNLLDKIKKYENQFEYTSDDYLEINHIRAVLEELVTK